MSAPARSPIGLIFLTIFIDMVGFGIMIPVLPLYATGSEFAATPAQLGWLVGIYSLLQLVFSPIFGKISDRVGRKPVLVFSILGTAVGFVWYYQAVQRLGASRTVIFNNLVPVFGATFGVLLLDEPLLPSMLLGGAIAVAGVMLVTKA